MSGDLDKQIDGIIVAKEQWAKRVGEAISERQTGLFQAQCKVERGEIKQLYVSFVEYLEKKFEP